MSIFRRQRENVYIIFSRPIYLDNNATTPLDKRVEKCMIEFMKKKFGNPSSVHFIGGKVRDEIEKARESVARVINAEPEEIIFTSSGTEANNTIIRSVAEKNPGKHLITSKIEHPSVMNVFKYLEKKGFSVTYLNVDENGIIKLDELKNAITKDTVFISIMYVNNEIGSIQPIKEIADLIKGTNILFHSDIVQAFGKLKIDTKKLNIDFLSFSAHKIYGPKGIGGIYCRKGNDILPLILGGEQERKIRAGTEATINIIGFGKACEIIDDEFITQYQMKLKKLKQELFNGIKRIFPEAKVNGDLENSFPTTLNVCFPGIKNYQLLSFLDYYKTAISIGSACEASSEELSYTLSAIGLKREEILSSVRFSIGKFNTIKEIKKVIKLLSIFKKIQHEFIDYIFPNELTPDVIKSNRYYIADVRKIKQREKAKNIPNSHEYKFSYSERGLKKSLPRDKEILLVCEDGYLTSVLVPKLKRHGFNVKALYGGHRAWRGYYYEKR